MSAQNQRADHGPDPFSPTAFHPVPHPQPDGQHPLSSPSDVGMPPFSGRTHLPTPQSPDFMGHYVNMQPPESPLAHASYMAYSASGRSSYGLSPQKPMTMVQGRSPQQQTMTPESSPYAQRHDPSRYTTPTIPQLNSHYANFSNLTPRASSSITLHSPATTNTPPRMSTPPPYAPSPSNLSSPFAGKLATADKLQSRPMTMRPPLAQVPVYINDIFSTSISSAKPPPQGASSSSVQISTPPVSPTIPPAMIPAVPPLVAPSPMPGGELERIRQTMMQNQLAQYQEAEARRPDYLKRAKRPSSASDPPPADDESRHPGVGIMDSPHKGRRITLFQETSDESFEESLMAGGYGRYRTADWVRQPQAQTPVQPPAAGPSTIVKRLEELRPPTEKELRKRKRLEAFRANETTNTSIDPHASKLFPVTLEGKGRVLIDSLEEGFSAFAVDSPPVKNGAGGKRALAAANKKAKKKLQEPSAREKKAMMIAAAALEDSSEKPNWPDAEFPWRLRSEERAEIAKEEGEQRMQWIEKFLDRDTDEEDASGEEDGKKNGEDEELLSPTAWDTVYEEGAQRPVPARGGRGKMVPLPADPYAGLRDRRPLAAPKKSRFFPTDPGDARAALYAKKSVRALSYRQERRRRAQDADSDEEVACVCHNDDDDSQVVQCDNCATWYHLHCIGIRSIAQLGREEDPWYCKACQVVDRSESSVSDSEERAKEPTFVPTDNEPPRVSRSHDTPLFQPSTLQDSPMPWSGPKTPPRNSGGRLAEFGSGFSSASASDSRQGPYTPQGPTTPQHNRRSSVQIFSNEMPGPFDLDDAPFDPTSTPSRGIKFGGPFTTPKNSTTWPTRANGLFQTPSKRRDSSSRLFGAPGTLDESAGGGGVFSSPFGRMPTYDDSPIRRDTAPAGDRQRARGLLESPIAPSVGGRHLGYALTLEDSPVMWSLKGKERAHDAP
ncbi:hypothetical protein B0H15DRAFT_815366 [Mycena belliarum]|uniref:PHD-type domain-containing protein n=1 Tax=Mycena belliarum TaxID=1033014 RepID=A0AAD6UGK0_9AGAR|nr:hypothetical protein B0H15DRAFT_815366 [Mycena belliae]